MRELERRGEHSALVIQEVFKPDGRTPVPMVLETPVEVGASFGLEGEMLAYSALSERRTPVPVFVETPVEVGASLGVDGEMPEHSVVQVVS